MRAATAGSRLIRMPNTRGGSRRRASRSNEYGMTDDKRATPSPATRTPGWMSDVPLSATPTGTASEPALLPGKHAHILWRRQERGARRRPGCPERRTSAAGDDGGGGMVDITEAYGAAVPTARERRQHGRRESARRWRAAEARWQGTLVKTVDSRSP